MLRIAESPIATANAECREAELALPVAGAPSAAGARTFRPRLAAEFAADRPIYLLAALYLLLAEFLALILPGHPPVLPLLYLPLWLRAAFGLLLGFVLLRTVPETLRARPDSPLRLLLSRAATYVTPRAVAGVCLILLQAVLMGTFTSVKNMLPELSRYVWDTDLANIDRYVMGGHDGWSYVTPLLARTGLLPALEFFYVTGWMMALGLVPALVALLPSMAPVRLRFFLTYILCWALLGNIMALAGMSAGPAYFGEVTGDYDRHRALLDLLAANSGATWSAYDIQRALWQAYAHGMSSLGSGISAFPSLHVAMAVLWTIVGFRRGRAAGLAGLAFLTLVFLGSVALGWHYVLDGVAAAIMVPLIWWSVGYVLDRAGPAAKVARAW